MLGTADRTALGAVLGAMLGDNSGEEVEVALLGVPLGKAEGNELGIGTELGAAEAPLL